MTKTGLQKLRIIIFAFVYEICKQWRIEEFSSLGVFFSLWLLWKKRGKRLPLHLPFFSNNKYKIISKKFSNPIDFSYVSASSIYELSKLVIVRKNKEVLFTVFQSVTPSFKNINSCQKFLIENLINRFRGDHILKEQSQIVWLANLRQKKYWMVVGYVIKKMLILS